MQNTRDSSVLRSLAIAFGDGLAFGAGMKLTRGAARSAPAPSAATALPVDMTPLLDRLNEVEARIGKVERVPLAGPLSIAPPAAPFDQKVLEAIVTALDARLQQQAGQAERRLAELEARLAIEIQSLQQQDRSVVTAVQTHIEEWNGQINDQLAAIRRQSDEERAALQQEIASLPRELAAEAARAAEAGAAELRTEIASRDNQIAELQARLEVGDEKLRNVVLAIAQACQTALGNGAQPKNEPELPAPDFTQPRQPVHSLPLPLVSSLALVSAVGLAAMHYL